MVYLKKFKIIITSLLIFFFTSNLSFASELNSLKIDVKLLNNGYGDVNMTWDYYDDKGTEHYIPIKSKGIEISNLKVGKNSNEYLTVENWDVNGSIEDKKDKAGIIFDGDNYEVCWGIGQYGNNTYNVNFLVKDIIKNIEDGQVLHYRFLNNNLSEPPQDFSISIEAERELKLDNVSFWAFGFDGSIELEDGKIVGKADGPLTSRNYGHILAKFEPDFFDANPNSKIDGSFAEIKDKAFENSQYENREAYKETPLFVKILISILMFLGGVFLIIGIKAANLLAPNFKINKKQLKDKEYYNIPYQGDPVNLYHILSRNYLTNFENTIDYFFLKWSLNENIKLVQLENKTPTKSNTLLELISKEDIINPLELKLYTYLLDASPNGRYLSNKDFKKWLTRNNSKISNLIVEIDSHSKDLLTDQGYLDFSDKSYLFFKKKVLELSPSGIELSENLFMFKNYLSSNDYKPQMDSLNPNDFNNLLLYASIFGLTEEFKDRVNAFYPQYLNNQNINYSHLYMAHIYSRSFYSSYSSSNYSSGSSGSGGSTSFGGGGGGFGGGSGGGTR